MSECLYYSSLGVTGLLAVIVIVIVIGRHNMCHFYLSEDTHCPQPWLTGEQ